jgi:hypothetical protein
MTCPDCCSAVVHTQLQLQAKGQRALYLTPAAAAVSASIHIKKLEQQREVRQGDGMTPQQASTHMRNRPQQTST